MDVELKEAVPPDVLYHGTAGRLVDAIMLVGLSPQSRLYVHLSTDIDTAMKVGSRHGKPVVLEIDAKQMVKDGFVFYLSENNVWLTKKVLPKYIWAVRRL